MIFDLSYITSFALALNNTYVQQCLSYIIHYILLYYYISGLNNKDGLPAQGQCESASGQLLEFLVATFKYVATWKFGVQ